jgi:hypothetical protein
MHEIQGFPDSRDPVVPLQRGAVMQATTIPTCLTAALKAPNIAAAPPQSVFIPGIAV